jgi:hypothetical protein
MSKIDQGYKLIYIYIAFLMFLHVYFILFFSENKARLSSKIRSSKWRNKIKGESFDNILYLEEVDYNLNCPEGYEIYNNTQWPGTKKGIYFEKLSRNYPCSLILNKNEEKYKEELLDNNYELYSVFNPLMGGQNFFSEYHLNVPYFENCNDIEGKCQCSEKLDTDDNFQQIYPEINITEINKTKIPYRIIHEITPINLNIVNKKKLCGKKVKDFLIVGNNNKKECQEKGGVLCSDDNICIFNETHCPIYSNLTIFKIMGGKEKMEKNLISSLDINYNDITCSVLDNKTSHFMSDNLPEESQYILNKYQDLANINKQQRCEYTNIRGRETDENCEDIIFLSSLGLQDYYKHTNIPEEYKYLPGYEAMVNKSKDVIVLSATTYFRLNESNRDECNGDILQTVNESFENMKKISNNKTKNFFVLDAIFVLIFLAIIVGHFSTLNIRTEPISKFWCVKYLILFTVVFLVIYSLLLISSKDNNSNLDLLVVKLDEIIEKKCFKNNLYINHLHKLSRRLDDINLLNKGIYTKVLMENVFVIVSALALVLTKIPLKQLIQLKSEGSILVF